jgi:hypothetical protein
METTNVMAPVRQIKTGRGRTSRYREPLPVSVNLLQEHLQRGIITNRDIVLFKLLEECGVMSTDQIRRMLWAGRTSSVFQRRLNKLYHLHYLDRSVDVLYERPYGIAYSLVYALGKAGRLWLEKYEGYSDVYAYPVANMGLLLHDVVLSEIMVLLTESFRREGYSMDWRGTNSARFLEPQKRGEYPKKILEPDALLTVKRMVDGKDVWRPFFVEFDTGTQRHAFFGEKVARYVVISQREDVWKSRGFAKFPPVMLITSGEKRAENLVSVISGNLQAGPPWIMTDWDSFHADPLGHIWTVVQVGKPVLEKQSLFPL